MTAGGDARAWLPASLLASVVCVSGCYLTHTASQGEESSAADAGAWQSSPDATPPVPQQAGLCGHYEFRAHTAFAPVDLVWVVDSSRSMLDEQARITETIGQFVSDIETRSFDVRLVMVTANNIVPAPLGEDAGRYRFVARQVESTQPLSALLEELPRYRDFLRRDAALHFVVVTDDESALSARAFDTAMRAQLGRAYTLHAVASPDENGAPCRSATPSIECMNLGAMYPQLCGASAIGREYYSLAAATSGQRISICVDDFGTVFGPLSEAVTRVAVPCRVELDAPPTGSLDVQVSLTADALAEPVRLENVASEAECDAGLVAYYVEAQTQATTSLALCPFACTRANTEGVRLQVEVLCSYGLE